MLIIAVSGAVATGKSSLLSETARWALATKLNIDGFIAVAGNRPNPDRGAETYDLYRIKKGDLVPFASRDPQLNPPYVLDSTIIEEEIEWAASLKNSPPADLIVLDEFGIFEAGGQGHYPIWTDILAAKPAIVLISISEKHFAAVKSRLNCEFDLVISSKTPNAAEKLRKVLIHHSDWATVGLWGSISGGIESTVGAFLHAVQIPFRGHILSTGQSVLLMFAGEKLAVRFRLAWISIIAAGLKSFSPSGQRLRPMIAISIQGFLYSIAVTLAGWNFAGIFMGGVLIGAWASAQGVLLQYLFVGSDVFKAMDIVLENVAAFFELKSTPALSVLLIGWVSFSALITGLITLYVWRYPQAKFLRIIKKIETYQVIKKRGKEPGSLSSVWIQAGADLLRPGFWLPLILIAGIIFLFDTDVKKMTWTLFRGITIAWILFALVRMINVEKILGWMNKKGYWGPLIAFQRALNKHKEH
ncbi:MAG: hypothetical protein LCH54_02125 [Bacteroidetes bacterium]|nr:hypothetical protein [Bacteroidota bacterium]